MGAGVVGLAIARELAKRGRETILLEAASSVGTGVSSRNSEVVHAGIYYEPRSWKAQLCVRGKEQLYAFCEKSGVRVERIGKLICATNEAQIPTLEFLAERATKNNVHDLRWLETPGDIRAVEPQVKAERALFSPSTGVVDSHQFMVALLSDAEAHGCVTVCNTLCLGGDVRSGRWMLQTADATITDGGNVFELECDEVINCAGLASSKVALALGCPPHSVPPTYFAKGNYFALVGAPPPFQHLVYPVPEEAGLGVHATVDLAGRVRFGPDVEWVEDPEDYSIDPSRTKNFYRAVRAYWPELPDDALVPDYCGIRPKLQEPHSDIARDFFVQSQRGPQGHGLRNLINLYGIESPGLTSSMAIAELVANVVIDKTDQRMNERMNE